MSTDSTIPNDPRHDFARVGDYTPDDIHRLVHTFYDRVRDDEYIGPVFAKRIDDWDPHLARMVAFWRTILRGEPMFMPRADGGPPQLHRAIEELEVGHFEHWLGLFEEVASEIFPEQATAMLVERARRIGIALSAHLAEAR